MRAHLGLQVHLFPPSTCQCQTDPTLTVAVVWRRVDEVDAQLDGLPNRRRGVFIGLLGKTEMPSTQSKRPRFHLCASQPPNFQIGHGWTPLHDWDWGVSGH